jgi:hypothetical protein
VYIIIIVIIIEIQQYKLLGHGKNMEPPFAKISSYATGLPSESASLAKQSSRVQTRGSTVLQGAKLQPAKCSKNHPTSTDVAPSATMFDNG